MKRKLSSLIAAVFIGIGAFSCICQAAGMDIDKEDGEYSIQVDLEGGSGKASVTSPTILTVKDGQAYAQIQWSSSNYDYMIVDGEKYLPTNEEGMNSVFEIPVLSMDEGMPVIADTTAMGAPHEIDYWFKEPASAGSSQESRGSCRCDHCWWGNPELFC